MSDLIKLGNEIEYAMRSIRAGGTLESAVKIVNSARERYSETIDKCDPMLEAFIVGIDGVRLQAPFRLFCRQALRLIKAGGVRSNDTISSKYIAGMLGLNMSTIRKHAAACPGAALFGNTWVFKNSTATWEHFGKITPRKRPVTDEADDADETAADDTTV